MNNRYQKYSENIEDKQFQKFLSSLKEKSPQYRILCFPQKLIIPLWENIFNDKIQSENSHNDAYLWELNRHFKKIGPRKSNKILDVVENGNYDAVFQYHETLIKLIKKIEYGFMCGKEGIFSLNIDKEDTAHSLKKKIKNKRMDIIDGLEELGRNEFYKICDFLNNNLISIQVRDMANLAIEYILKNDLFLEQLLITKQQEVTKKIDKETTSFKSVADSIIKK